MRVECDLVLPISHQPPNHFLSLSHGSESLWPCVLYFSNLYSKKRKILVFTCRGWDKTSRPYNEVAKKETSSCGPEELPNQNSNWLLHRGSHAIFSLVGPYIWLFEILSNIRLSQVNIKKKFIELFEYWASLLSSVINSYCCVQFPITFWRLQPNSWPIKRWGVRQNHRYEPRKYHRHFLARDFLHRKLQRHVSNSLFVVWSQLGAQLGWWGTRRKA